MLTLLVLALVASVAILIAFRRRPDQRSSLLIGGRQLGVSLGLMAIGPAFLWPLGSDPIPIYGGLFAFALGWLLFWGSLHPGGSFRRGALLGVILYVVIGVGWSFGSNQPENPLEAISQPADAIGWPLTMSVGLGLFGLELN